MKKAFTLIEMLIVVGIIAVLMSIVLVNVRGATDSANATKCMNNMRSLFVAMDAIGMDSGSYPLAGPCVRKSSLKNKVIKSTFEPWVGRDHSAKMVPCYGTGSDDEDRYAITNGSGGVFWKALAGNDSAYNCPLFAQDHLVKRKRMPLFSYALNAVKFASDVEAMADSFVGVGMVPYNSLGRADRAVMFAELPIKQSCGYPYDPLDKPETCDATLKPDVGNPKWKGSAEEIGFVHQDKRKRYYGHVVFVDGHIEKFMQPPASSSLKAAKLTAHICSGDDVAYDERGYRLVANAVGDED